MSWRAIVKLLMVWCLCAFAVVSVPGRGLAVSDQDLLRAAEKGRTDRVQTLLAEGAEVNAKERGGATALMLAAFRGHTDTVQALLNAGAAVDVRERNNATALMLAVSGGHTDVVRALLAGGADVNVKNNASWTALMIAARGGYKDIVQALLAKHADPQVTNEQGQTALMLVGRNGPPEIVQLLTQPVTVMAQLPYPTPIVTVSRDSHAHIDRQTAPGLGSTITPNMLGRYHALVIGINDYTHIPPLKTAIRDATAVAQLLEQAYNFNVQMLLNATRADIIAAFDNLRATLTEQDNVLIYYAGHGHLDAGASRGYWLPVDADPDTRIHWVSNADITDTLKALTARHVLVVSDSCYSGTLTRGIKTIDLKTASDRLVYLTRMAQKRSRTVLTSGGVEPVADDGIGGHSVFAGAFLDALRDNDDLLDGQQLFTKIRRQVVLNANQTPQYEDLRFADHQGGDFLFVRNR